MKKLFPYLTIIIGSIVAINALCIASTAKPNATTDSMEVIVENPKEAKKSAQAQETKQPTIVADDQALAQMFEKILKIDDLLTEAPGYYATIAQTLATSTQYNFSGTEVRVLYLPSYVDCIIMCCLTENTNWHTVKPDGCEPNPLSETKELRYSVRATINNMAPCSIKELQTTYGKIIQQLKVGWTKDPQNYTGYTRWAKKQTLRDESLLILGFAGKCGLTTMQVKCCTDKNIIYLSITNDALATFESKLWSLPKA